LFLIYLFGSFISFILLFIYVFILLFVKRNDETAEEQNS